MSFSSPIFLFLFLPIIFSAVLFTPKKWHNILLMFASIFFYAWGNVSHAVIFLFSIILNYSLGLLIASKEKSSKRWLIVGLCLNLILLFNFKYLGFVIDNINSIFLKPETAISYKPGILPLGISFFTFHALSYIIDIYRKKVKVQRNFVDMALYISFFPQLVAGPIVRYIDISEQLKNRTISIYKIQNGMHRFIFGLAKKLLVANTMAYIADQVFDLSPLETSTSLAWLGIVCYSFHIYFDFSGYSDMAIGLAEVFGFKFPENFNYPYIAQSIRDFWHRWHISLSTWFRDYLYIPLGGSKGSKNRTMLNLWIVFLCTGLWHGASWNFVVWGLFHGLFLTLERTTWGEVLKRTGKHFSIAYTILIVMCGWVFFRAETMAQATQYLANLFFVAPHYENTVGSIEYLDNKTFFVLLFALLYSLRVFRWTFEKISIIFSNNSKFNLFYQLCKSVLSITLLFISILVLSSNTYNPFIYFRF